MKKFSLVTLIAVITLGFSSCSVEEEPILQNEVSGKLFEKVAVSRNADGSYYLDMKLKNGAGVDVTDSQKHNGKDLNFYNSDVSTKKNLVEDLEIGEKGNFKLGVNNTIDNSKSTITVFDNDIKFNRSEEEDHLSDYTFTDNGDGTYDLDFTVDNGIDVEFIFNEDTDTYEIHLTPDSSNESNFSRTFEKNEDEELKISFINYFNNRGSRTENQATKKPVVVVGED